MGHRGRARGYALGRGAGGIPIPPDIEAEVRVETDDFHAHQFGTSDIMNLYICHLILIQDRLEM